MDTAAVDVRQPEVGVIEDIEELRAKLKVEAFAKLGVLQQGDISIHEARTSKNIPAKITNRAGRLQIETIGIDPSTHRSQIDVPIASRVRDPARRNRWVVGRVVRTGAGDAAAGAAAGFVIAVPDI